MKVRLILWGIGKVYNSMINLLKFYDTLNQVDIVGVTAEKLPDYTTIDGYKLMKAEEVQTIEYDYLMVMSDDYFHEIVNSAVSINIKREKIISYHILEIPYFDFKKYVLIRNQNMSIVSNNCWGGLVCHTLSMECCSPFKNVSFSSDDYMRVLGNLKHYLRIDPVWKGKTSMDTNQNKEVPLLELDDVVIKCNHDPDAETAIRNWKRRRDKFNWNNIFVEMYTEDPVVEKAFGEVSGQYNKRLCFVPYETMEAYSVRLPLMPGQTKFYEAVNSNVGIGKNALVYNILEMMNMNKEYRMK